MGWVVAIFVVGPAITGFSTQFQGRYCVVRGT